MVAKAKSPSPKPASCAYNRGEYAQVAFPELDKALREQIISGTHPKCWEEMFAFDEDASEDDGEEY